MRRPSRHPIFSGVLVACFSIALAEVWLVGTQWRLAKSVYARIETLGAELRGLHDVVPPLNVGMTAELNAELAEALNVLAGLRAELTAAGDAEGAIKDALVPLQRADGYFVIASFVERMRQNATRSGVAVKADERFGFSDYTHAGPDVENLSRVLREQSATEFLLKAVFDARPRQLVAVQRERRPVANTPSGASSVRADYFDWDSRASIKQPGLINTFALRVLFVGQTVSLRTLLNRLAEFDFPLVVRAVEVEPAAQPAERGIIESDSAPLRPLVSRSQSRFAITVEVMEWVHEPGAKS